MATESAGLPSTHGTTWEVFRAFLKLGLTSFGGPVAHLGYFRAEFVERRKWISDREYADLVALCQFLPGPASSQVGFGIGLHRAGFQGAWAAFVAFTLPSAALLVAFAYGASLFQGPIGAGLLTGLKIVAVAIVAQAVWGMAQTLTPDKQRASIAVIAATVVLLTEGSIGQIGAIVLGAIAGLYLCRTSDVDHARSLQFPVRKRTGALALALFVVLLIGGPLLALVSTNSSLHLFDAFFRAGTLVFGGGHVVLPLLQSGIVDPGWVTDQRFLAGYGAAQAVPGPLFTFAAYLGTLANVGPGGILGAALALIGIFLPGFLLLTGVLPFWGTFKQQPWAQAMLRGANAAVVGILAAALYNPVFTSSITGTASFCLALTCFVLLVTWKLPPWTVVIIGAVGGIGLALLA